MTDESRSETTESGEARPKWIREAQDALDRTADAVRTAWDATRDSRASALEAAKQAVKELGEALERGLEAARERWEAETSEGEKPADETVSTDTSTAGDGTESGIDTSPTTPPAAPPTQPPPTTPGDTEGESGRAWGLGRWTATALALVPCTRHPHIRGRAAA